MRVYTIIDGGGFMLLTSDPQLIGLCEQKVKTHEEISLYIEEPTAVELEDSDGEIEVKKTSGKEDSTEEEESEDFDDSEYGMEEEANDDKFFKDNIDIEAEWMGGQNGKYLSTYAKSAT
ncbi:hypothetical protein DH2020_044877 [Rehmannia glutinosa]|uniref:Uncharacterized protein n=1 Tax=Rehmannia glutinosa TaxID=99300 RepID=A0ABR0UFP4_REHGL